MTPDTPINLASVSKPVLGMGLIRLHDEGRLDLDADVNAYLPFEIDNPNMEGEVITVRTLAAHTSGIGDFYDTDEYTPGTDAPQALDVFLADLLAPTGARFESGAHYLKTAPGEARAYSNLGAGIAGAILESVTDETLAAYQQRTLFAPLGMTRTSWRIADYNPAELAVRYGVRQCMPLLPMCANTEQPIWNEIVARVFDPPRRFKGYEAYPQLGNPNYPDGGLNASARDLGVLMQTLVNDGVHGGSPLFSAESMEEMFRPQAVDLDDRQRFFWRDRDGFTGHAGSDRGVFTYFYFDRASRSGYVVLINRTPDAGTERAMDAIVARIKTDFLS
jgi:CubicO group peptidase (beta-lactamase class C family)